MQFRDLKAQYIALKSEINEGILDVIESSTFIGGKPVKELEKQMSEYVGVKHCVTCGNGTDALDLALIAWGIGEGDAVFVPDFTFFASGEVVSFEKATPIFVDVNPNTFNISVESLEAAIQKVLREGKLKPRVIIAVDLFGQPADYPRIRKIADKYQLKILEDAAQGFGGSINGQKACSFGDISTTSFFPAKPLGCYGDGGAIFTNDDKIAELLRSLCVHGKGNHKYNNVRIGMNSRLDTIQAAILLPKFRAFCDYELTNVNNVANYYTEKLSKVVKTPDILPDFYSSWAQYSVLLDSNEKRDGLQKALQVKGIPTMIYYPKPMHKQEAFINEVDSNNQFPCTDMLCETILSLPIHPYMNKEEQDYIIDSVLEY